MIRSLPITDWPQADQLAWRAALNPGKSYRRGGSASKLQPVSALNLARRYGYFLTFAKKTKQLKAASSYASLVTPENIERYIAYGRRHWEGSITLCNAITNVHDMHRHLNASGDYLWLREIVADLKAEMSPKIDRPFVTTPQLVQMGTALFQRGVLQFENLGGADNQTHAGPTKVQSADEIAKEARKLRRAGIEAAKSVRDGLIITLLSYCPIRARTFIALELGRTIRKIGDSWWLTLKAEDTKTQKPDERMLPGDVAAMLEVYLASARPLLLANTISPRKHARDPTAQIQSPRANPDPADSQSIPAAALTASVEAEAVPTGPLWISCFGKPLNQLGLGDIIADQAKATLGLHVTPHMFRNAAAATAAHLGPSYANLGSALLQHSSSAMTDHYNKTRTLQGSQAYGRLLRGLDSDVSE